MPNMDGTGPVGLGPMTGWGGGNCALRVIEIPDLQKKSFYADEARPSGWGQMSGRGMRRGFRQTGINNPNLQGMPPQDVVIFRIIQE